MFQRHRESNNTEQDKHNFFQGFKVDKKEKTKFYRPIYDVVMHRKATSCLVHNGGCTPNLDKQSKCSEFW